ncbi:MAG: SiaC family regulatory phosphoprotein [Reichenbachiella sp.]|uniref:SiaC family regulatory phosphoprotein n=1 Tax=Reichenbachiella sp. TaxID=2184521 RepID=UPI003264F921
MDGYFIRPTGTTPSVNFRPGNGELELRGNSMPDDPLSFYGHVFSHLTALDNKELQAINVNFALKNISDSTTYLHILVKKLISLATESRPLNVTWYYEKNRTTILDIGREISEHYNHPFKFVEVFKIKDQLRQAS